MTVLSLILQHWILVRHPRVLTTAVAHQKEMGLFVYVSHDSQEAFVNMVSVTYTPFYVLLSILFLPSVADLGIALSRNVCCYIRPSRQIRTRHCLGRRLKQRFADILQQSIPFVRCADVYGYGQ